MTEPQRAIILSELPAAEARGIFDRFVAGQPGRLAAFLAEVGRRAGPAGQLDFSIESLEPLWGWLIANHRPRRWLGGPHRMPSTPVADAVMRANEPPWWYEYHPQFGQELGPYAARLVTGVADYLFACALHAWPGSRWALGRGRSSAYFQHPVFELPGRGEIDYASPIVIALHGLRGERNHEPVALRRWLEQWLGMDPAHEAEMERLARQMAAYAVEPVEHPRFTHQLSFDDDVAHRQERRIGRLVEALIADPVIEDAVHEDREIVLVRAPSLSATELETVVAGLWKRRAGRSHARSA
jgi:hypothetical protein